MTKTSPKLILEAASRINSDAEYQNYEVNLLLQNSLPANAAMIPVEISHPSHADLLKQIFAGYALTPAAELKQLVMPIDLGDNQLAGLHLTKTSDNKISALYFDPIGIDTPFNALEPYAHEQAKALTYSSIPRHLIATLNESLNVSSSDISISSNRIQDSFFDEDGVRCITSNNSGLFVAHVLRELSNSNINYEESGLVQLIAKSEDGRSIDMTNLDQEESQEFSRSIRKKDLREMKEIFPAQAEEIDKIRKPSKAESNSGSSRISLATILPMAAAAIAASIPSAGAQIIARPSMAPVAPPPSVAPTYSPTTNIPTTYVTPKPTRRPRPTVEPTPSPTQPSNPPSANPTANPTRKPSEQTNQASAANSEPPFSREAIATLSGIGSALPFEALSRLMGASCAESFVALASSGVIKGTLSVTTPIGIGAGAGAIIGHSIKKSDTSEESATTANSLHTNDDSASTGNYMKEGAILGAIGVAAAEAALLILGLCARYKSPSRIPAPSGYQRTSSSIAMSSNPVARP